MPAAFSRRVFLGQTACLLLPCLGNSQQARPLLGVSALLDGASMVRIPAGSFQMGSNNGNPDERPVHTVRITRPFEIGKFEVTQGLWENVMRNAHTKPDVKTNVSKFEGIDLPVDSVTWDEAQDFLKRLNDRDPNHTYRLPTEAEWEYASAGGPGKHAQPNLEDAAWYLSNSQKQTQPVAGKRPNSLGMFDTIGNVAEWVQDWYAGDYYGQSPAADPKGPETGSYRVYRGASWLDSAQKCRLSYRGFDLPANQTYNVGFRVVRTANA